MVRVNEASLFRRIDLDDPQAIRRIMIGLNYHLTRNVLEPEAQDLRSMTARETQVVHTIIVGIRLNPRRPLLLEASLRFLARRNENEYEVLRAAASLEALGAGRVLLSPDSYEQEFKAVQNEYIRREGAEDFLIGVNSIHHDYRSRAPGAFWQQTYRSTLSASEMQELEVQIRRGPSSYIPHNLTPLNMHRCIDCRRLGISCSREEPACWACRNSSLSCHYSSTASPPDLQLSEAIFQRPGMVNDSLDELGQSELADDIVAIIDKNFPCPTQPNSKKNLNFSENNDQHDSELLNQKRANKIFASVHRKGKTRETKAGWSSYPASPLSSDLSEISESGFENLDGAEKFITHPLRSDLTHNKPVRKPGERAIDDGSYDRGAKILVGEPNPSLMHLRFRTEKDDPEREGEVVPGHAADYWYAKTVNWKDRKSVDALKKWRTQIFSRNFGTIRETRHLWLEEERDFLFEILQEHLLTVGGRWLKIDWEMVATQYNKRFSGTEQKAGKMTAGRRYRIESSQNSDQEFVSASRPLAQGRVAPTRSAGSMRSQIENFSHITARKIVSKAKAEDKKSRQEGGEIPDSNDDRDNIPAIRSAGKEISEAEEITDEPEEDILMSGLVEHNLESFDSLDSVRDLAVEAEQ